jgi:GTP-binding protein
VNSPSLFDATYQRYLMNVFREKLPFKDIPIKLYLRARSQSHAGSRKGRVRGESQEFEECHNGLDDEVNELLSELDD